MPGRWNDERERDWQDWRSESEWRDRNRSHEDRERWQGREREQRSFGRRDERVFGERDSGAEYNRPRNEDWQRRDYGGVSPAMSRGDYDSERRARERLRFRSQDYTRNQDYTGGGRFYGDDAREPIYREEYGQGGYDYGSYPRGYDEGGRYQSREDDDRWSREMRRPVSGGTGGYDYERGYGDAGRGESRYGDERGYESRGRQSFEDRAQDAGDFFRRTGQKISSWFSGEGGREREDERRYNEFRGARGLGPKGYQRSDDRISDEVHQRLTDDPWVDASNIDVAVSKGEVTLSGSVESRETKHRAERVVEDLSGVKHVQNNLRVQAGNYFTSASRGYGDSAEEAQMRKDTTDGASQTSQSFQQSSRASGDESAATRSSTRRT